MERVVSISYGELALKGANRGFFEKKVVRHIKQATKDLGRPRVYKERGKVYVETKDSDVNQIIERLKKVFGIVLISPGYRIEKNMDTIAEYAVKAVKDVLEKKDVKTFKVEVKRADKKFPINSMDVARKIGGIILENIEGLSVDVHNPELSVYIDIRDQVYIFTEKIKALGGLPVGTNGKGLVLLSGGIDSPVASYMIAKRGVKLHGVHYHSYPFTSERAEEKVKTLAKIVARYNGDFKLYSVNLLNIQKSINQNCPEDELTIISRRFMMRIAEKIAEKEGMDALVTGESLGQVASQTIKGLNVTNASVSLPVFRPLIGMDKTEIIDIAHSIETFETSILPYEDCCTVFLPKHPVTRPKLVDIEKSEEALDVEQLIEDAIEKMEIIDVTP